MEVVIRNPVIRCRYFSHTARVPVTGTIYTALKNTPKCIGICHRPPDTNLDTVGDMRFDVDAEPVDAVDGLLEFVGTLVLLRVLEALGAERAQQQSKKQIEHLSIKTIRHAAHRDTVTW